MNCGQPENQGLHWEIRTETIATLLPYLLMAARVAYPSGRNSFLNKIKLARPLTERGRVGNRVAVLPNERDSAWRIKIRVGFVDDLYFRGKKKKTYAVAFSHRNSLIRAEKYLSLCSRYRLYSC